MFDEIDIPEDLSGLSVSELQALLEKINEAGKATAEAAREITAKLKDDEVTTEEAATLAQEKSELAETIKKLQEAQVRVTAAHALAVEAEEAENAAIEEAASAFDDPETDGDETDGDAGESTDDTPAETDTDDAGAEGETTEDEPAAIAASGKLRVPVRSRKIPNSRERKDKRELDSPFFNENGDRIETIERLGELFQRAGRAAARNGDGMARVVRLHRRVTDDPNDVVQGNNGWENRARMGRAKVIGPESEVIMAAGGFCGPAEAITEIEQCGRTDRPIGAGLPTMNARGAYRYVKQVGLDDVNTGIDYWTNANDQDVDPEDTDTWKPCYHLECAEEVEAVPVGIPACFQYGTFQQWSFPEQVAAALAKMDVALARRSEALVMQRIHEQSNQFTYQPPVGESATNGLIRAVGQLLQLAYYGNRNSLDGYVLALTEAHVLDLLVDSKIKAWVGPTLTRADILSQLEDTFQIRVIETPDVRVNAPAPVEALAAAPAPAGGGIPCPHTRKEFLLYKPGDFRHGVDDVDIVVQTDIATARRNDKSVFLETIETTEKLGCSPSFSVLYDDILVTGSQPDLVAADAAYCPTTPGTPTPYGVLPVGFPGGAVA